MKTLDVLFLFGGFILLVAIFEFFYWVITQRIGIVAHVEKATLVGIFWLIAMIAVFLLHTFPDLRVMLCGLVAYALHATMCDKFSYMRRTGRVRTNSGQAPDDGIGDRGSGSGSRSLQRRGAK